MDKLELSAPVDVGATILEREKMHGSFTDTALCAQSLKGVLRQALRDRPANWTHTEALDMICTKLARIVHGDANHADHWHDIAGYATLVELQLKAGR